MDGRAVGTVTPAGPAYADYATGSFAVAAGAHTVMLAGVNNNGQTVFVNNIRIIAPPSIADPYFQMSSVGSGPQAYLYAPTDSPWTYKGSAGVAGNGSGFTAANPTAPQESEVAFLQGVGSVGQSVTLAAGAYVVSFEAAQRAAGNHGGQTIAVLVNGKAVTTIAPAGTSYSLYTTAAFNVAAAGAHTIALAGTDPLGGDNTAFVDEVSVAAAPPLVPTFEVPALGSGAAAYRYDPAGTPWTFSVASGISGNDSDFTRGTANAPAGSQVAFLQSAGTMSQSVTLAAGTYEVELAAAQRGNDGSSQGLEVLVDGRVVGTVTPAGPAYADYATGSFAVAAGAHTIMLAGVNNNGQTVFVDNIRIIAPPTIADPGFASHAVGAGPTAYVYDPQGTPWTFSASSGVAGNGSGFTSGNPSAPFGAQVAFLQGTGEVSQSVNLAAGAYEIDFQAAQRVNANSGGQEIGVVVNGRLISVITPVSGYYALYQTLDFSVGAGFHTITLIGLNPRGGDNTAFIDDVRVQIA